MARAKMKRKISLRTSCWHTKATIRNTKGEEITKSSCSFLNRFMRRFDDSSPSQAPLYVSLSKLSIGSQAHSRGVQEKENGTLLINDTPVHWRMQVVDFKNVQRRVYDALNVLNALGIISKDRNKIRFIGDYRDLSCSKQRDLEKKISTISNRVDSRRKLLAEKILQVGFCLPFEN